MNLIYTVRGFDESVENAMNAQELLDYRRGMDHEEVVFCYSGYVTEEILVGVGQALKAKLREEEEEKSVARNMFSLFVEQVQNVIRYSRERITVQNGEFGFNEMAFGVFAVGRVDGKRYVSCGNVIDQNEVARMRDKLEHIQTLDAKGLKTLYKEILRGETPEGSKGAGVGLLDIARRATGGLDYDFVKLKEGEAFFALTAYI
ncbi:hypothetical protein MAIT1_03649 [Magnetofaba australis IT-1]|uniref:Uncharacterized protein n=2 Tax=Magnetofaba TaxID=1472292 RepID=A0A1Y2K424_9PROT|nr:hypothetical protein MAIT1_03649 [Magnetofaba australis IT-1]